MVVHNLGDKTSYTSSVVNGEENTLIVIDCFATWCGPCKAIAPTVQKFSEEFPQAQFYKIDVDEVPDVAQELGIRAMPTFILMKGGQKVAEVVGANAAGLKNAIQKNLE